MSSMPAACTASVWKAVRGFFALTTRAASAIGSIVPTSLLTYMMLTSDGVVGDGVLELLEVDEAFAVDAEVGDAEAFLLEPLGGVEDGVVLDGGGDDVLAAALARRAA